MEEKLNHTAPLIQAEGLTLAYDGTPVVEDLSFSVAPGAYLCIVGANGSGKSTLMKALTGILPPARGKIRIAEGVSIGYLPQQSRIQRDFPASVREVVLSGCLEREKKTGLRGMRIGFSYSAASRERAKKALDMLGMGELAHHSYNALSGGQQQRVLLARALCASDTLLLLDEPVTGLDPTAAREMYAMIRRLNNTGTAILMVTHDMEAALEESSHILCLCQRHGEGGGAGIFFGTTEEYRASLSRDECSCCGMEHDRSAGEKKQILQLPQTIRPPKKPGAEGGADK